MNKKALIYVIAAGIGWGASSIFVNILPDTTGITSPETAAIRTIISAILILTYILFANPSEFKTKLKHLPLHILSGLSMYCTGAFYYSAITETSVSVAVVLMYTAIIVVMCYSVAFFGERLNRNKILAVIMTIVGCILVTGMLGDMKFTPYGIFLGFMASVSYSTYNIVTKIEMRKGLHPLTCTAYCFVFAALSSAIITSPIDIAIKISAGGCPIVLWSIGVAIVTCTMPYLLYTLGLKNLPAGVAASLAIIEPLSASIFSIVFFKEQINLSLLTGIILILGAVVIISKKEKNYEKN